MENKTTLESPSIVEMNRVIQDWDGWERVYPGTASRKSRGLAQFENKDGRHWSCFISDGIGADTTIPYNTDWNYLMAVVEKISTDYNPVIRVGVCYIERKYLDKKRFAKEHKIDFDEVEPLASCNSKDFIGCVHQTVYDFIVFSKRG
jgi:hypothetical protein